MLTSTFDMLKRVAAMSRREVPDASPFEATRPFSGAAVPQNNLIFRLKAWPDLPESGRTAEVYRMLSVMSSQPVNRQWLLARCRMAPKQLDDLLLKLLAEGALEVINPARFARAPA
ncbi:MAG: hypothetical protein JWP22_1775 [Ramlibacter sp.]|jgi:hypothetical protein|nr:hypothetical protein [Ramlibacter sp.]MDB5913100.1 hypothetical protein [Ramlibacter sp.]